MRARDIAIGRRYVTVYGDVVEVIGPPFKFGGGGPQWWWPIKYVEGLRPPREVTGEPSTRSISFVKPWEGSA